MHNVKKTLFNNQKGLTLVEVLASIVILSIIMISILMILAQTAKTNKTSEEIIDATYYAQAEMERIYNMRIKNESFASKGDYIQQTDVNEWKVYHKAIDDEPDYYIQVRIQDTDTQMTRVVVEIYEVNNTKSKVLMENLFENWGWAG